MDYFTAWFFISLAVFVILLVYDRSGRKRRALLKETIALRDLTLEHIKFLEGLQTGLQNKIDQVDISDALGPDVPIEPPNPFGTEVLHKQPTAKLLQLAALIKKNFAMKLISEQEYEDKTNYLYYLMYHRKAE